MAALSFENAVRLHEDAILLFKEDRIPSALFTESLAIEEMGKYYLYEDVTWQSIGGVEYTENEIQEILRMGYSHILKQKWFARASEHTFVSKTLIGILSSGQLEQIKQKATYVGFSRKGKRIQFERRVSSPFRTSRKLTMGFITTVNDCLIALSVGSRKGVYMLDVPEIDDWIAQKEFAQHFTELWPYMRPSTRQHLEKLNKYEDEER